jgi:hypothetical protein
MLGKPQFHSCINEVFQHYFSMDGCNMFHRKIRDFPDVPWAGLASQPPPPPVPTPRIHPGILGSYCMSSLQRAGTVKIKQTRIF